METSLYNRVIIKGGMGPYKISAEKECTHARTRISKGRP